MNYYVQNLLKADGNALKYLRENSHWYKVLNRSGDSYKLMIDEMKERYRLRPSDKINNLIDSIELISNLMEK